MLNQTSSFVITLALAISMILVFLAGKSLKIRRLRKDPDVPDDGFGAIEGALLGLLALLLSFTFGMANSRYDNRFQAMVHEANCIGTAILRADLFPDSARTAFREELKAYLDSRISLYDAAIDPAKNDVANQRSAQYADLLWKRATGMARSEDMVKRNSGSLMVGALNDMFDSATSRKASRETTLPESILWLLFLLCIAAAFIVGYGVKRKLDWVMVAGFSLMVSITVFAILDLDRPHRGFITLDKAENNIVELRALFK
jgi:hypothetical protein